MQGVPSLYSTSIGKKIFMAVTGILLVLFVIGHMIGNLKAFQGAAKFDHYAEGLRSFGDPFLGHGQFLWIARVVLLASVLVHMIAAWQTWRISRRARPRGYRKEESISFSYASSTMRWGGVIIGAFVVFHILHLTTGTVHPNFVSSAYANLVTGFQAPWVAGFYLLAMALLSLHLYHGIWSACQTLDINNAKIRAMRRPAAALIALVVLLGFISVPLAVLLGILH